MRILTTILLCPFFLIFFLIIYILDDLIFTLCDLISDIIKLRLFTAILSLLNGVWCIMALIIFIFPITYAWCVARISKTEFHFQNYLVSHMQARK